MIQTQLYAFIYNWLENSCGNCDKDN